MPTDTFAAILPSNKDFITPASLSIDFTFDKKSPEITYAHLSTSLTGLKNPIEKDPVNVGCIPIYHPAGIVINKDNWAGFLYLQLTQTKNMSISFRSIDTVTGFRHVKSYLSFGYYYFEIESILGTYVIIVDRPEGTERPTRAIKNCVVVKTPADELEGSTVFYNDGGIYLPTRGSMRVSSPNHEIYYASFKERLNHRQIIDVYGGGIGKLKLTPELFHKATDDWDLQFYSFHGFEYFESLDGKVIFTIQNLPTSHAFTAFTKQLRLMQDNLNIGPQDIYHFEEKYREATESYVRCQPNAKTLDLCIAAFKEMQQLG